MREIPHGPVVKNPPCNARDAGLIPDRGTKTPYAAEQLSSRAISNKPYQLERLCEQRKVLRDTTKNSLLQLKRCSQVNEEDDKH